MVPVVAFNIIIVIFSGSSTPWQLNTYLIPNGHLSHIIAFGCICAFSKEKENCKDKDSWDFNLHKIFRRRKEK